MGRQKTYVIEEVLTVATEFFLRKGYEATSLNELVTATGLNRQSMYNEFGDKEGLFLACIKHYTLEERNLRTAQILSQEPLSIKNVEEFLQNRIEYVLSDNCYGCLLVNSISEREVLSQRINDRIDKIISNQEHLICNCIEAAIKNKEISKNNDCHLLANYFSCFFRGLMNMAKGSVNKNSLENMSALVLSVVKQ